MNAPKGKRIPLQLSIVVPARLTTEQFDQQTFEMLTLDRLGTIDESCFEQAMLAIPFSVENEGGERWENLSPPPNYQTFVPIPTPIYINANGNAIENNSNLWMNLSPPLLESTQNTFMSLAMVEVQ